MGRTQDRAVSGPAEILLAGAGARRVFSDDSFVWMSADTTGFYELEYRFNLYSKYEVAETFARDIRRRHNSILHTKWKPMRNPIAPYTFTRLNVHSRHSTDIRQTFK